MLFLWFSFELNQTKNRFIWVWNVKHQPSKQQLVMRVNHIAGVMYDALSLSPFLSLVQIEISHFPANFAPWNTECEYIHTILIAIFELPSKLLAYIEKLFYSNTTIATIIHHLDLFKWQLNCYCSNVRWYTHSSAKNIIIDGCVCIL